MALHHVNVEGGGAARQGYAYLRSSWLPHHTPSHIRRQVLRIRYCNMQHACMCEQGFLKCSFGAWEAETSGARKVAQNPEWAVRGDEAEREIRVKNQVR